MTVAGRNLPQPRRSSQMVGSRVQLERGYVAVFGLGCGEPYISPCHLEEIQAAVSGVVEPYFDGRWLDAALQMTNSACNTGADGLQPSLLEDPQHIEAVSGL